MRRLGTSGAIAVGAVLAAAIALWLATGVAPGEIARYLGYELGFVIVPGWLLLRAISPATRSPLTQLAIGWPLGLVAEIGFFSLTAALDARDLFYAYPAIVGVPAAFVWWRRSRRLGGEDPAGGPAFSTAQIWTIAALCLIGIAFLGLSLIAKSPIPGSAPEVHYEPDNLFHISVAADALHHWPPSTPQVSGVELNYHYFVHLHLAAIAQVTGIELPIVYFRLFLVALLPLILLQLSLAGRSLSGLRWAGPLTAALFLVVWELDLIPTNIAPWFGINLNLIWTSPSYTLALTMLVPLTAVLVGLLEPSVAARLGIRGRAAWVVAALLTLGIAGAKVVALPLLAGGLALYLAWRRLRERIVDRGAVAALALCAGVFAIFIPLLYGTGGGGLRLGPGGIYEFVPGLLSLETKVPDSIAAEVAFWGLGSVASTLLLFGPPLLGLWWVVGRDRPALRPGQRLLLCVLTAGLLGWLLLNHDVAAQFYFGFLGVVAALPLAAEGLHRGLAPWFRGELGDRRPLAISALAWLAIVAIAVHGAWLLSIHQRYALAYALPYGVFAAGLLLALVWGRARPPLAAAAISLAIIVPASLDIIVDWVPDNLRNARNDEPLYDDATRPGITPDQIEAAEWIRDNLDPDAVLTISNQGTPAARRLAPLNTEFPAFSERRAFYEGWAFAVRSSQIGRDDVLAGRIQTYPLRHRLEQRLFRDGDPRAARRMAAGFGVTHLVIVRGLGEEPPRARGLGRVVYENPGVEVIELPR